MFCMATIAGASWPPAWLRAVVIGRNPKRTLGRIVILAVTCFVVFRYVLLGIRVEGASMLPTYRERGVHVVNRLAYRWSKPKRRDVVVIRLAGPSIMYMKRIIGLPGETVEFHQGKVLINGEILDEPYLQLNSDWEWPPFTLGPDEYFVVGDNRSMAWEDHTKGKTTRNRIAGKILL